jgi:hypothetical protein
MTPAQHAIADAIGTLEAYGFEANGHTPKETVRVSTAKSPVYGSSGGELRTLGGRMRFCRPGTDFRATVGKLTTYLYRANVDGGVALKTKDKAALQAALEQWGLHPEEDHVHAPSL